MKTTKIIALLLALAMTLCLVACGDKNDDSSSANGTQTTLPEESDDIKVSVESSPEPDADADTEDSSNAAANDFERGTVSGNTYTNNFAGVTFTAPDGMYFYTDEEIAQTYNLSSEMFELDAAETVVYDMYCSSEDGSVTFNINYENLQGLYGLLLDEKSYLEISKSSLEDAFSSTEGLTIDSMEITTTTVGGVELDCIDVTLSIQGYPFYEKLVVKEIDGFMAVCTGGAFTTEELDALFTGLSIK